MSTDNIPSAFDMTQKYWGNIGLGARRFDSEMSEYRMNEHKIFWSNYIDKAAHLIAIKLGSVSESGTPIITEVVLDSLFMIMVSNMEEFKSNWT